MSSLWRAAVAAVASISDEETRVERRGFQVADSVVVERLESIGRNFVAGYNAALRCSDLASLEHTLRTAPEADTGFRFEGAAMGLAVRDWMTPSSRLMQAFVDGVGNAHEYMAWVGRGWAFARLPGSPMRALERGDSLTRWLALDGYGFHQGYFGWRKFIARQQMPRGLPAEAVRVFDQGLGRSLWFVHGAEPGAVSARIQQFVLSRQGDLWSGVGLASAYAGGLNAVKMQALRSAGAAHFPQLAQGIVFAAEARRRAGNPAPHTDAICRQLLGLGGDDAAQLAIDCRPASGTLADYRNWRESIQEHFDNSNSTHARNSST